MEITQSTHLLGGLSPAQFMHRYWQKKPLLIRSAAPGFRPLLTRSELFALAARDDVESRLLRRHGDDWDLCRGPFARRQLPRLKEADWTLLVQGVDAHADAVRALLERFRFVPDARLDDVMISYAADGGGVGPHFDSYDVFLLQAKGRRRWRVGHQRDLSLVPGLPLKILARFEPTHDWVLEPGDMLYLPPRWAHDGVALGECMTYSIGFRAPSRDQMARELLYRVAEDTDERGADPLYADSGQIAVQAPGEIPAAMARFAEQSVARLLADPARLHAALGKWLTEPKANVWFQAESEADAPAADADGVAADRRTRMLYLDDRVFINGESVDVKGRDAQLMRRLADRRCLERQDLRKLSAKAKALVAEWISAGWLHGQHEN